MTAFPLARDAICRRQLPSTQNAKIDAPNGATSSDNLGIKSQSLRSASCVVGQPTTAPNAEAYTESSVRGGVAKPRRKREKVVSIRVPKGLRQRIERLAKETGVSINQLGLAALIAALDDGVFVRPVPLQKIQQCEEVLYRWLVELNRQGNNLNQLAVNANKAELRGQPQPIITRELVLIRGGIARLISELTRLQKLIEAVKHPSTVTNDELNI
jgi:predicted HicB family RNase H-like nuclease